MNKASWAENSIWAEKSSFFKIALKRVLVLPKERSRQMRQFPQKKYGFTKRKHIRGDKTLRIYNCGPM